jgi:hypothetical protein
VRYRSNDYSVPTAYGHREVLVRGYVHQEVISCGAELITCHHRSYEREDFVFDPLHYLALPEQKIGALDQAARRPAGTYPKSSLPCAVSWRPERANPVSASISRSAATGDVQTLLGSLLGASTMRLRKKVDLVREERKKGIGIWVSLNLSCGEAAGDESIIRTASSKVFLPHPARAACNPSRKARDPRSERSERHCTLLVLRAARLRHQQSHLAVIT